ncbi:MAG TPA: 4'-phosphopantetheinyl transferase superfamily protein [Bacteroidales bacterium]|nr:4'-phosphopantetheinyl transferase superfamily protein [Bacteroidales bacterium]
MILVSNFSNEDSISGIREITKNEIELYSFCNLSDVDNMILSHSSLNRRLEILNVRALIKELRLDIKIHYKERKPICSDGFISITHSDDLAAVIWSRNTEYSIDIERISPRLLRIAKRAFSETELEFALADLIKLSLLWNCKECVYKLANDKGMNFQKQIQVQPFSNIKEILCHYIDNKGNKRIYRFSGGQILDHTYVWGKQIRDYDTER